MFCEDCGEKLEDRAKFCSKCGKKIHKVDNSMSGKSRSSFNLKSKRAKIVMFASILCLIYIFIKSTTINTVSHLALSRIKIEEYFPQQHQIYTSYYNADRYIEGTDTRYLYRNVMVPNNENLVAETCFSLIYGESTHIYSIADNKINKLDSEYNFIGTELCNKPEWIYDDETKKYITGVNVKVETKCGRIDDCIEVTTIVNTKSNSYRCIEYWAPKLGIIKRYFPDDETSEILVNYDAKNAQSSSTPIEYNDYVGSYSGPISIEDNSDSSKISNEDRMNINYINSEYGFQLLLPESWENRYSVSESNWYSGAEKTIDFNYLVDGEDYGSIFSIVVFSNYDEGYDPNLNYIGQYNGKYITYLVAREPSERALKNEEVLNTLRKMITTDVDKIVESIGKY